MFYLFATLMAMFIVYGLFFEVKRYQNRQHLKRWGQLLDLPHHEKQFNALFAGVNGFQLSQQARLQQALDYTYGEIEFLPFVALLSLVKPCRETIFYDLGCGTGKATLACAMVYPVAKSVGVEIFPLLHQAACMQKSKLARLNGYKTQAVRTEFILGDFLTLDFQEANLIFINATCFLGPTWDKLCQILDELPHLQTVISTTKPLISSRFVIKKITKIQVSWGIVSAFIHGKKL